VLLLNIDKDFVSFGLTVKETDLCIWATKDLTKMAFESVLKYRFQLEEYIKQYPLFKSTIKPLSIDYNAPEIVKSMMQASQKAGVGPMAAVAGAIAEYVGMDLLSHTNKVVVENGGDIFIKVDKKMQIKIYAGQFNNTGKTAIEVDPDHTPLGVCTSSGTIGHSFSYGKADAVTAVASSAILADAAATALANHINKVADMDKAIRLASNIKGLKGAVLIKDGIKKVYGRVIMV